MRKRRSLENGKWYCSKATMKFGKEMSAYCKKYRTKEQMDELVQASITPEVLKRKSETNKRYFRENPHEMSRRMHVAYKNNPDLRKKRADQLKMTEIDHPDLKIHYTDSKNVEKRRTHRNGRRVLRIIKAERQKSVGVVII